MFSQLLFVLVGDRATCIEQRHLRACRAQFKSTLVNRIIVGRNDDVFTR